jgi:hypothetical protein
MDYGISSKHELRPEPQGDGSLRMGPGFVDFLDRRRLSFSIKDSRGWRSDPHRSSFPLIIICQNLKKVGIAESQFIIQCFSSIYLQASFIDEGLPVVVVRVGIIF